MAKAKIRFSDEDFRGVEREVGSASDYPANIVPSDVFYDTAAVPETSELLSPEEIQNFRRGCRMDSTYRPR